MIDPSSIASIRTSDDNAYRAWDSAGKKTSMRMDASGRTAGPMPYFGTMVHQTALAALGFGNAYAANGETVDGTGKPDIVLHKNPDDEFSFGDVVDMINPLHHLPVIGMIYRNLTDDTIKPISNIIGGTIFGGPMGAVTSTVNAIIKNRTGRDIAENALAAVGFNIAPQDPKRPDIVFENATSKYESTHRNFAKTTAPDMRWNA